MHDSCDIGLDGLHESTGIHVEVSNESPSPFTSTRPTPSSIPSAALQRPGGRKGAKYKRGRNVMEESDTSSVWNNKLSDHFAKWSISQNNQFQIIQETNKAQFEDLKSANEFQAFHLTKKTKLEQLQFSIAIIQSLGDAEQKMLTQSPHLLTPGVLDGQTKRFKKLQDLERRHDEIIDMMYSPGVRASMHMNSDGGNIDPCNLGDRINTTIDSSDQE